MAKSIYDVFDKKAHDQKIIDSLEGYKKVDHDGKGSFVTATFWNPSTHDEKYLCVRDYDYSDCSRDIDELYYMEVDQEARKNYLHSKGQILEGDTIMVIKGRKIPHGSVKKVRKIYPLKDKYKRWIADYCYFTDGTKTNIDNCVLVMDTSA